MPGPAAFAAPAAAAEPVQASRRAWYARRACADERLKPRVVRLRLEQLYVAGLRFVRLRFVRLRLKRHAALASRARAGGVSPRGACLRQPSVGDAATDAPC